MITRVLLPSRGWSNSYEPGRLQILAITRVRVVHLLVTTDRMEVANCLRNRNHMINCLGLARQAAGNRAAPQPRESQPAGIGRLLVYSSTRPLVHPSTRLPVYSSTRPLDLENQERYLEQLSREQHLSHHHGFITEHDCRPSGDAARHR